MRARLLLPCVLLALAGCPRKDANANLASEVKTRLAEREAKLTSYRIAGTVKDEGQEALSFTFDYRAPQRMRLGIGRSFRESSTMVGIRLAVGLPAMLWL